MSLSKILVAALTAVGFAAAAASASACEWHNTVAKASTPQAEEQADANATPLDPVVLARSEAREESQQIEQK